MSKKTAKTGTVTDDQGRVRFHGAFTGGFSAGYFNTVGSSEGFKPAQFVSSRSNRASRNVQSVSDFMDEGDGLLGGKLSAVAGVDSFVAPSASAARPNKDGSIGEVLVGEVIQQQSDTIGKKLLAAMGWRVGHGIGPRITKKRVNYFDRNQQKSMDVELHPGVDTSKLPAGAVGSSGRVTFAPDDEEQKIAFPPTKLDFYGIGFDPRKSGSLRATLFGGGDGDGHDSYGFEDEDEEAPSRYSMSSILPSKAGGKSQTNPAKRPVGQGGPRYGAPEPAAKRLKYTSGFAYDDGEDDVYTDSRHGGHRGGGIDSVLRLTNDDKGTDLHEGTMVVPYNYRREVQEVDEDRAEVKQQAQFASRARETLHSIQSSVDNWLGADGSGGVGSEGVGGLAEVVRSTERCLSDQRPPLPGFHVARVARVVPPHYPPLVVPADYVPHHTFADNALGSADSAGRVATSGGKRLDPVAAAQMRSAAMDETKPPAVTASGAAAATEPAKTASIFDLLKPEARAKLQGVLDVVNPQHTVRIAERPFVPPPPPIPPPPPLPAVPAPPRAPEPTTATNTTTCTARPMLTSSVLLNSTFAGLSQAFKNRFAAATTAEGAGTKDSIVVEGMATASEYSAKVSERQKQNGNSGGDSGSGGVSIAASQQPATAVRAPPKGSVRTTVPWAPSTLLCKRMNVKVPDLAKAVAQQPTVVEREPSLDVVSQLLSTPAEPPVTAFGGKKDAGGDGIHVSAQESAAREEEFARHDVYQMDTAAKPALAVFKSIFEDSDSSDSEEESEDEDVNKGVGDIKELAGETERSAAAIQGASDVSSSPQPPMLATTTSVQEDKDDGVVRFVPSKLRATARSAAGAATVGAPAVRKGTAVRRPLLSADSEAESDQDAVKPSVGVRENRTVQQEDEEELPSFVPTQRRAMSQSYAAIGTSGVGRGRTKATVGSLRQQLLSRATGEDDDVDVPEQSKGRRIAAQGNEKVNKSGQHAPELQASKEDIPHAATYTGKEVDRKTEGGGTRGVTSTAAVALEVASQPAVSNTMAHEQPFELPSIAVPPAQLPPPPPPAPMVAPLPPPPPATAYTGPPLGSAISRLQAQLQQQDGPPEVHRYQGEDHSSGKRKHHHKSHKSHKESKHKHKHKHKHKDDKHRRDKHSKKEKKAERDDSSGSSSSSESD